MMKKLFTTSVFTTLMSFFGFAQSHKCGSMDVYQRRMLDPEFVARRETIAEHTRHYEQFSAHQESQRVVYTIPVVFHVVFANNTENISDAQLISQIDVLNEDFRKLNGNFSSTPSVFQGVASDMEFEFCLASIDPNGNPTSGITRTQTTVSSFDTDDAVKFNSSGGKNAWPANQYLNIWVADLGGGLLGYAQFPGDAASTDGVVLNYITVGRPPANPFNNDFNLGRTATHEIGHWMNLYHIWGNENSGCGNQPGSAGTDEVSDTPVQDDATSGCPNWPQVSCNNGPNGDMITNYMDYMDDACATMFTNGQKTRARAVFAPGGPRNAILSSQACSSTPPPPPTNTCLDTLRFPLPSAEVIYGNETDGFVCGTNTYLDSAKADKFTAVAPYTKVKGGMFKFAVAEANGLNNYQVTFRLYDDNGIGGLPGTILASTTVPISTIAANVNSDAYTTVQFASPITVSGSFYLGYVVNPASGVVLSLYSTENGTSGANTAYEQFSDGTWFAFETEPESWGIAVTQTISAIMQSTNIPATPQITNNGGVLSVGSVTGTVQWYLNNSAISGATSTSFSPSTPGSYTVIVTNQGCSATSAPFNLSSVGVESLISAKTHVFPNPTTGDFTVLTSIAGSMDELRIVLFDLSGKEVYSRSFSRIAAGVPIQISTEGLASGIYQLMLVTSIEKQFTKIAVSR
jgi:hypothetical protein